MALQPFGNRYGTLITPQAQFPNSVAVSSTTIDAVGESAAGIGHVLLSTGPGTSKTISSAGGKLYFRTGSVTFADAGTTVRVGIQDVGAAGLEDGTYDVHDDLVGGTDTITGSAVNSAAMSSGTKTITHGDQVAVVIEMTARGGTDSVQIARSNNSALMPYGTADTGAGPTLVTMAPFITIEFDDGTLGWLGMSSWAAVTENSAQFDSGDTPDEYALVFRLPFKAAALGLYAQLASVAAGDDFEVILYSAPLGTPVAERTLAQDMSLAALGNHFDRAFTSAFTLEANTDYAIAIRPSTANGLSYTRVNFGSGNGVLRKVTMLGTNWSQYSRSNQTGAFGSQDTTLLPVLGVWVGQLEDGAGGGGGTGGGPLIGGRLIR